MPSDADFFRQTFIDYYHIDIDPVEAMLRDQSQSGDILGIALRDYESKIILFSSDTAHFHAQCMKNSHFVSLVAGAVTSITRDEPFQSLQVCSDTETEINAFISWKRNLLLYVIFDSHKINIALANTVTKHIAKTIKSLLENTTRSHTPR